MLLTILITGDSSNEKSLHTLQYHIGTNNTVLIAEGSSNEKSLHTLQYHIGTNNTVLIAEGSSNEKSLHTLQYHIGTNNTVLITEGCSLQRSPAVPCGTTLGHRMLFSNFSVQRFVVEQFAVLWILSHLLIPLTRAQCHTHVSTSSSTLFNISIHVCTCPIDVLLFVLDRIPRVIQD